MKIAGETIKGLIAKRLASGDVYFGWEPTLRERKAGWKSLKLPRTLEAAIAAARIQNEKVETWKNGGEKPRAVKAFTRAATFGSILDHYEREKLPSLAPNSRRVDQTQINYLREWAGHQPVAWITRKRVRALRDTICPAAALGRPHGAPGHNQAFKLLSKGREVFSWARDHPDELFRGENPFERFNLPKPAPRQQVWSAEAQRLFCQAADDLGWHSVGLAVRIGAYTAQREADLLKLTASHWHRITLLHLKGDAQLFDALVSHRGPDAGHVMGIRHIQNKTKAHIGVPIEGDLREEVEAALEAARERVKQTSDMKQARLIAHDKTGAPWGQRDFIEKVGAIRAHAITLATKAADEDLAALLATLQFRDLRRTCVVTLADLGLDEFAISAITGHDLKTIIEMLKVYGPRNQLQAARGVVARIGPRPAATDKEGKTG